MALEGSLDTFGLTDVLSLLAMTNKTGDLRLHRVCEDPTEAQVSGYVRLRDGLVVAASSDDARQALARRLIVSGLISDEAFAQAISAGAVGDALPAALASAAGLTTETVSSLTHEQVLGAVFELLRWPNGAFTFDVVDSTPGPVDASLSVEEAIAEATNRLAAWPALTSRVPAPDTALAVAVTIGSDASLTPAEWGVLGLFDGHRTIAEAITLSTSGEWETVSLLAGLVERGLLVPAAGGGSAAHRASLLNRIGLYTAPATTPATGPATGLANAPATVPTAPVTPDGVVASVPSQAVSQDERPAEPELDSFASLHSLADAASALETLEEPASDEPVDQTPAQATDSGDGVDEALLQRLIAGVRAL